MRNPEELEDILNYKFTNRSLLQEALIHSSLLNESRSPELVSNERLEYLGDAVVGLIIAEELFTMIPAADEGELTRLRSKLVCRSTMGLLAKKIRLGEYLFIGRGEEASGGRQKPANLARGLEAILGAIYLDGGIDKTKIVVLELYGSELRDIMSSHTCVDSKSHLQELVQALKMGKPAYRIIESNGPDHNPDFTAEVLIDDKVLASGRGKSKKMAEASAAMNALQLLSRP